MILSVLIFLMSGTGGMFSRKLTLKSYFDDAGGLRVGAPVRLQGVDIGNVTDITVVPERQLDPVQVTMKVGTDYEQGLRKDSKATLSTAGVLGETFVNIVSREAKGPPATDGDVLAALDAPDIQDVVKSTQTSLQNMDVLLKRLDRIVASIERGEGSVGKFIMDPTLFNRVNATLAEVQNLVNSVTRGQGTVGKLLKDEEMYRKLNATLDRVNRMVADIDAGKGTAGKFLKDDQLYNNANQTIAKANQMMDDVNAGRGALGKFAKDEEFARKLDNTMTRVNQIADRMAAGEGTVGKLLTDQSLYVNLNQTLSETRNLMQAVRENPKKYLTIKFEIF